MIELAVGYQGGHWEQVIVEAELDRVMVLAGDDCLAELLPEHIRQRQDVSFVHLLYVGEDEEQEEDCDPFQALSECITEEGSYAFGNGVDGMLRRLREINRIASAAIATAKANAE